MEKESASNEEENNEQSKRDHINDRLREMGVTPDSVRPKKSLLKRNVNFLLISIVVILVGAFAVEYQSSKILEADTVQVADQSRVQNKISNQTENSYNYNQQPKVEMGMQTPVWVEPQYSGQTAPDTSAQSVKPQLNDQENTRNSAENNTYQNNNYGWYGQQGFYKQPQYQQYYGQPAYQQPSTQSQPRNQPQVKPQNQEQQGWSEYRQPDYRGQYNNPQYGNNNWPGYGSYYAPMPNPYAMPYPTAGYYNGWYR